MTGTPRRYRILILLLCAGACLCLPPMPLAAQLPEGPAGPEYKEGVSPGGSDYLIVLPVTSPRLEEVPPHLTPERAADYARMLTHRMAQPLRAEIATLRASGRIEGFEVRPDLHGVVVSGVRPEALDDLSRLSGGAALVPYEDAALTSCAAATAEALEEQLMAMSYRSMAWAEPVHSATGLEVTDPIVHLWVPPDSSWTSVDGFTEASVLVSLRIIRNGQVIASGETSSLVDGYYEFTPYWRSCPVSGYSWTLRAGDVVEVSAEGARTIMVVPVLSAWVDPVAKTVAGVTAPGNSVDIYLNDPTDDLCTTSYTRQTVSADMNGSFVADFAGRTSFNRTADAWTCSYDASGNRICATFFAYRVTTGFGSARISGYLKPNTGYSATLSRGGSIIDAISGSTTPGGYYEGGFQCVIEAGDIVRVSAPGIEIDFAAAGLALTLDHIEDVAIGRTTPGREIEIEFEASSGSYTSCVVDGGRDCTSWPVSVPGDFHVSSMRDLKRGDSAYVAVYDGSGNYQYAGRRYVPALIADLSQGYVDGYWGRPFSSLEVSQLDSAGVSKASGTYYGSGPEFLAWFEDLAPSDRIEVSDGVVTETMTVQSLAPRLDSAASRLVGGTGGTAVLAHLYDARPGDREQEYCAEQGTAGGGFDLVFDGAEIGPGDSARVWSTGPDGHYTSCEARAFSIAVQKDGSLIEGYGETANVPVTVTLRSGDVQRTVRTTTTSRTGHYSVWLDSNEGIVSEGDTVEVVTRDGNSGSVTVPAMSVFADAANNTVYGTAPPNAPIEVQLRRVYNWGAYWYYTRMRADDSGTFGHWYDGLYWPRDCSRVDAGHRCAQPALKYYTPARHEVLLMGAWPSPPAYDAYESDDEAALASPYQGTQSHSFHSSEDVDWVRLTVPSFDVARGVSYRIETRNLGWGMDTVLELYDTDGATQLVQNDDGGAEFASQIRWTPTFEGTYYVKVRPYSSQSTAYCDAYYDLLVVANRGVVLPTLMSDYHPFWCDAYEPNDHREVNAWGPLQPGVTYSAKLCRGDAEDNYWFDVSRAGRGYVDLTLPASLVGKTAVAVYVATNPNADIAFSDGPVESAQYRLEYDASHAGRYLVRIYAENAWDDAAAYTLRVSVP